MTEEEIIQSAFTTVLEVSKKMTSKKLDSIGVHDLYISSVEMEETISYHAVKGKFPERIFKEKAPNQTEEEAKYIKNNYKQHTLPVFVDYISTISRPMSGEGNWSIKYKQDDTKFKAAGQSFQDYVEKEMPVYGSLENFIKSVLPTIKTKDANGFIAIRPTEIKTVVVEGELRVDETKLNTPGVYYFESKNVVDYNSEYYLFLSQEKSVVTHGGKQIKEGLVFELYTKDAIFFISQTGEKSKNTYHPFQFYRHDFNDFPVKQLMGIPTVVDGKILWQSPFLFATDLLELVAINENYLQVSINKCVFPITIVFGSECEYKTEDGQSCVAGYINIEGHKTTCRNCNGTGIKSRLSPLGTMVLNSSHLDNGDMMAKQDPVKFVSPGVETLEFLKTKIKDDVATARSILKLRNKNSDTSTAKDVTATEVYDDSKSMTAFVKPISDQIFDIYGFALKTIGKQRYGEKFEAPDLTYPKTFDFKTPEDYLLDLKNAMGVGVLPPSFIQILLLQYINAFYSDGETTLAIFKLIVEADRLFGITDNEINIQLAKGLLEPWEKILHTSIFNYINKNIAADPEFLNKPIEGQIEAVKNMAKEQMPVIQNTAPDIFAQ